MVIYGVYFVILPQQIKTLELMFTHAFMIFYSQKLPCQQKYLSIKMGINLMESSVGAQDRVTAWVAYHRLKLNLLQAETDRFLAANNWTRED